MATSIDFPNSPTTGDTYTYGITTYIWDGAIWHAEYQLKALTALTDTNITSGKTSEMKF